MGSPKHSDCRTCGGAVWFGKVQFKGNPKPSWICYSECGHGGGGIMAMEKHDCKNPFHNGKSDKPEHRAEVTAFLKAKGGY